MRLLHQLPTVSSEDPGQVGWRAKAGGFRHQLVSSIPPSLLMAAVLISSAIESCDGRRVLIAISPSK